MCSSDLIQVVQQTEQAYWEVVYAYANLQVQLEAVDIARQQDESNRRQEAQGLLAPIDVVAAQTQLANFELNAYSAQSALTRAENSLKSLILADRSSALWASAIIPTTEAKLMPPLLPLADAVQEGLMNRPELAAVAISTDINKVDTKYYREQTRRFGWTPEPDDVIYRVGIHVGRTDDEAIEDYCRSAGVVRVKSLRRLLLAGKAFGALFHSFTSSSQTFERPWQVATRVFQCAR